MLKKEFDICGDITLAESLCVSGNSDWSSCDQGYYTNKQKDLSQIQETKVKCHCKSLSDEAEKNVDLAT